MKTQLPEAVTYAEHAADIIDAAVQLIAAGERFALIVSLSIEGGAAREIGSLAIVRQDGGMIGYLSNGCIDRDIALRAGMALESNRRETIRYGDGSRFVDLKLPCGGALDVRIDPTPDHDMLIRAHANLRERRPATLTFDVASANTGADAQHSFTYLPPVRLCLAGRGAIFRSMAQLGAAAGYEIHLISPDEEDLAAVGQIAAQPPLHLQTPADGFDTALLDSQTAFLTLFHDHDWEPALLFAALGTRARFIGALGSRRTHAMRCETLRGMGASEDAIRRIRGPIGLVRSLRDASLISVSALAEIVAEFPTQLEKAQIKPKGRDVVHPAQRLQA